MTPTYTNQSSGMPSLPSPKPFQMCRHGSSRWLRAAPALPALSARAARSATWTPGPGAQRGAALALCAEDEGLGESGGDPIVVFGVRPGQVGWLRWPPLN